MRACAGSNEVTIVLVSQFGSDAELVSSEKKAQGGGDGLYSTRVRAGVERTHGTLERVS